MEIAVCRALGGTSWTWGGRCVAYDDVDWMDRDFVQDAHWPLKHDELRPWYKRATEYMLCGSDQFSIPYNHQLSQGLTFDFVERWAREPKVILEHRDHLYQSARVKLSLSSTLTALNLSSGGDRVESLSVACPVFCISVRVCSASVSTRNGPVTVTAKKCILAMGGVETTRLLLHTQRDWPAHFGGANGPLGRYYMGHISGSRMLFLTIQKHFEISISNWMSRTKRTIAGGSC